MFSRRIHNHGTVCTCVHSDAHAKCTYTCARAPASHLAVVTSIQFPGDIITWYITPSSRRIFPTTRRTIPLGATRNKEIVISRDTVRQISLPTCQSRPRAGSRTSSSALPRPARETFNFRIYRPWTASSTRAIQQRRLYWALLLAPAGSRFFSPAKIARSLITF